MERVTISAIHSPDEHRKALEAVGRIMELDAPDDADLAMLETLAILVERYEQTTFPLEHPSVQEAVRFRMEQLGLNQTELAKLTELPKSRVSGLLNGHRSPSLAMIRALHDKLGIPLDILIGGMRSATAS